MIVAVNEFVKRQTKFSGKTYSEELSFNFFARHAQQKIIKKDFKEGYRPEVIIVKLDKKYVDKVICPYVRITKSTKLSAKLVKRRENEEPYIQIRALNGKLIKAGKVELILYHHDILFEKDENTTDAEWELISINALPEGITSMPMGPITMMRNQLELIGGTKATYSIDEWANSVHFWQKFAPIDPKNFKDTVTI
tara:strand:- start:231 stop:815 length:585 start_codon:yes stop_codon:yes gene_type:complete